MKYELKEAHVGVGKTVTIPDGGKILRSESAGINREIVLYLEPIYQCDGKTSNGSRCSREVGGPDETCYDH